MSLAEADEAEVLPAAGAAADTSHRRRLVGISTIIVVFTLALALRRPTSLSPSEGALWAEDGQIFIQTWLLASGSLPDSLGLLVEPYAAQLWPLHRALTGLVSLLPVSLWAPTVYWVSCFLAAGAMSVILQERAAWVFGGFGWRLGIASALVLAPGVTNEIQGNIANLHWYLAAGALVALVLPRPRTRLGMFAELLFVATIAFTGVLGIMLAPVALWVLVGRGLSRSLRCRYTTVRSTVVLIGAVLNLVLLVSQSRGVRRAIGDLLDPVAWQVGLSRYGSSMVEGASFGGKQAVFPGLLLALVLVALVVTLAILDIRGPSPWWLLCGALAAAGGLFGGAYVEFVANSWWLAPRNASLLVFATLLVVGRSLAVGKGASRAVALVLSGMFLTAIVADSQLRPLQPVPTPEQIAQFQRCLSNNGGNPCVLPTAPEGWSITVEKPSAQTEAR